MPIQRHGRDFEAFGECRHGQRFEPTFISKRQGLGEDLGAIDPRAGRPILVSIRCTHMEGTSEASRTAALMAVQRGLESSQPPARRLFSDPLAPAFVSHGWKIVLSACRLRVVRGVIEDFYDYVGGPGPRSSAIARTRLIDEIVEKRAPTVDQVVILGAGYDTRPYRLGCLSRSAVFEVDHPDTQAAKVAVIARTYGERPGGVGFVPVDFERDDLVESLRTAGFSTARSSLFLWEGVTQYLSEQAVNATLAKVNCLGDSGSVLVFTYVDKAVIDGDLRRFPEAKKWLRGVQKRGEPWKFGISPGSLSLYLNARGFELIEDVSTAEAGELYFGALGRHDRGSALYRIVTASIV